MVDSPLHFQGTTKSKIANNNTHHWINDGDDRIVCYDCDCVYGGIYSQWPCGYPVPRTSDFQ